MNRGELGVTRRTVYRLYKSTDDLLRGVGAAAADDYLNRLAAHVADLSEPGDALVKGTAQVLDPRPKHNQAELRAFLQRWVAPAVRATTRPA